MKIRLLAVLLFLGAFPAFAAESAPPPITKIPLTGFKALFNGKDMKGWHWSRTVRHGSIGGFRVEQGAMALYQEIFGQGGLLMSDKRYKDFELYLEIDMQPNSPGYNSGIFLRSTESGYGYQVELTGGPVTGNMLVEAIAPLSVPAQNAPEKFTQAWKTTGWNSIRVRMIGDAPHMTLWLNDVQMWDVQQTSNSQIAGETDGLIGLQLHWTAPTSAAGGNTNLGNTVPQASVRFRNIFIKEL
ncbi:MAG: hypothetical protein RL324_2495 [Verrucomicrobiota bacterium]|jgi:hypothetical protein